MFKRDGALRGVSERAVATLTAETESSSAVPGTPRLHLIDGLRVDIDTGEVCD